MERGSVDDMDKDPTLVAWLSKTTAMLDLKPSSRSSYGSLLRAMVAFWGDVRISELTPLDVQEFASHGGLSPSRRRQAVMVLNASLRQAVRYKVLDENPCEGVNLPRLPRPGGRALTREQIEALANECGPYRDFVRFLAYTGLRWSEAVELRGDDVEGRRIRVSRAAVAVGGGGIQVGTPKSHEARTVFVPEGVAVPERFGGELLWTTTRGKRLVSQNFRQRVWVPACERAGVEGARVHDLRHSACALMIRAGVHPRVVQQVMGHADISTTMRVYSTVYEDQLEGAAEALGRLAP